MLDQRLAPQADLPIETRRDRIAGLLDFVQRAGVADEALADALGVELAYLHRVKSECDSGRALTERRERFLNKSIHVAMWGIASLLQSRPFGRRESGEQYLDRIVAEISELEKGDRHTLVSGPPPSELTEARVVDAVVVAASRGARFRYYYPDQEALGKQWRAMVDARHRVLLEEVGKCTTGKHDARKRAWLADLDRDAVCVGLFQGVFGWIDRAESHIERIMKLMLARAAELNAAPRDRSASSESFVDAVKARVRFAPLACLPISFNEKIVWIARQRAAEPRIRKEIFIGSGGTLGGSVYDARQEWMSFDYPIQDRVLASTIRLSRRWSESAKEVEWKCWDDGSDGEKDRASYEPRDSSTTEVIASRGIVEPKTCAARSSIGPGMDNSGRPAQPKTRRKPLGRGTRATRSGATAAVVGSRAVSG